MNIHIFQANGTFIDCCERLGLKEEYVRKINAINKNAAKGEEVLGLMPTRSYRVAYGDTIERIALRFGIQKKELMTLNPWLATGGVKQGDEITLRLDERRHGMRVANGYYHEGTSDEKLAIVMPYLTYVTFASAVADRHGFRRVMNDRNAVEKVVDAGKIPLVRVHDCYGERFKSSGDTEKFAESLTEFARQGGYRGIVLNSGAFSDSAERYSAFLILMRKKMIGCDLILITEINENSPLEFSEYADGSVMYYPKFAMANPPSFMEGERRLLSDFACRGESAKAFVDIPCLAKCPKGYCSIEEALDTARRGSFTLEQNESTLLSHFHDGKQGEYIFESLSGLKALFELIHEFDYMGICFDIMRVPISFLMMYNAIFKTCYQVSGGM